MVWSHTRNATDTMNRCINIDWLEVSVLEPPEQPHDAEFFRSCGCVVVERDYGTRVWQEMFTIEGTDHLPFMEVRRAPKSDIIAPNVAHLRFVNRVCYFPRAAGIMQDFIDSYHYTFVLISRIDICYDFEKFDYGDDPRDFMRRFMEGRYSKINQADIHAHGTDEWAGRVWNSVSWGSPSSDIGTKLYNKTLELYDPVTRSYGKPYIRQAWRAAGLIDNPTTCEKVDKDGKLYVPDIWRIEFSIRSSVKRWFTIRLNGKEKAIQSIRNTLDMYDTDDKLLIMFMSLTQHYFHFKHLIKRYRFYQEGKSDGYALGKYKCPDKLLFRWKDSQQVYKVEKAQVASADKPDRRLLLLLSKLKEYRNTSHDLSIRQACDVLITELQRKMEHADMANPLTNHDAMALRQALREHIKNPTIDPAILIRKAREELKLRDEILPSF